MKKRINNILSATALTALISLIACNSPQKDTSATEKVAEVTEEATNKIDTVIIDQMKYIPAEVIVNKGDTLLFINKDIVAHDITEKNKTWASNTLQPGDSWKYVPQKSDDYFCSIHIVMTGKITVQ